MSRRKDIKAILNDSHQRKHLMVDTIIATQAREGIETTPEQAEHAYYTVQCEKHGLPKPPDEVTSLIDMRFNLGTEGWYLNTDLGWYWCDGRTKKVWMSCPMGPSV